jgi:predicted GNAT superfamily acetyltransferase
VESDRFSPDWWIATRRVKDRIAGKRVAYALESFPPALETKVSDAGWREPVKVLTRRRDRRVSVEIPDDIDALKKSDLALAQRWREATREAFLSFFKRGYVVHGFASIPETGRRRSFHLLEKGFKVR